MDHLSTKTEVEVRGRTYSSSRLFKKKKKFSHAVSVVATWRRKGVELNRDHIIESNFFALSLIKLNYLSLAKIESHVSLFASHYWTGMRHSCGFLVDKLIG